MNNVQELKERLLLNLRSCLLYLLPNGTFRGDKFYVGNIQGDKGKSLVVELSGSEAGLWHDFATGEGGDIIDLWAGVHRKSTRIEFPEVMTSIAQWLGHFKTSTAYWDYYDENGQAIVRVYRYDDNNGKRYLPFDIKKSTFSVPEIRPLYNIPGILKSDKILLVEGEKCANALIEQGITATNEMSGDNADPNKTDWTPLKGKHVIIWPDNDEPGKKYAEKSAMKLTCLGVEELCILEIPKDKPKGWDAADCVKEGIPPLQETNGSFSVILAQYGIRNPIWPLQWPIALSLANSLGSLEFSCLEKVNSILVPDNIVVGANILHVETLKKSVV
ncbi:hypothetical protein LSTR_LSTR006365 [Laodelphax striatellus]|uniref:Toprim domain-containing protein n=1 Tax=Laodelphax striatellus TaxID=195883 RepID=A0A482XD72_LAOST|nr:hypothetical protein LSTR_LSTR006365 [Laodelphax striatellus]